VEELLDREDPSTPYASDARHWIAIYRERLALYGDLLQRLRAVQQRSSGVSRDRAVSLAKEIDTLEAHSTRHRQRLEFWYSRQWALEGLELDLETRRVSYKGRSIHLTGRELQLFETLAHRAGGYMLPQQLLVEAWRDSRLPEETLRTYIVRLRGKLAQLNAGAEIVNRPRHGYALVFATPAVIRHPKGVARGLPVRRNG
jgi:DNA-binding response OmpR family regulator